MLSVVVMMIDGTLGVLHSAAELSKRDVDEVLGHRVENRSREVLIQR